MTRLDDLLTLQSGVVTRRQLLELSLTGAEVRRRLRRKELVAVGVGVYVNHTGELTWIQQVWAAVLSLWPAALCHQSALRAADGPGRGTAGGLIHVAVDRRRSPAAPAGVRLHQLSHLDDRSRDRDLDRDLDALVEGRSTGRLGWGQVFGRPCDTARRVGHILQLGGWRGAFHPCPSCASHPMQYPGVTG